MAAAGWEYYEREYGGTLTQAAFEGAEPQARAHVRWLCGGGACEGAEAFERAVCAAAEALAEWGAAGAAGFTVGSFSVRGREGGAPDGSDLATAAALRELGPAGLAFAGAGR